MNPYNAGRKTNGDRLIVIETDNKWIKEQLKEVIPKINQMHETFIEGEGKITTLNKVIFGNGNKGLFDDVQELKKTIYVSTGIILTIITVLQIIS